MISRKPVGTSFIGIYVGVAFIVAIVTGVALTVLVNGVAGLLTGLVITVAAVLRRLKQYEKEVYTFTYEGIRVERGSRFTSVEITVPWENVTSIQYQRPFFERVLFDTGTCMVDSAGSSSSSVSLRHVQNDVVDDVVDRFSFSSSPRRSVDANTLAAVGRGAWQALSSLIGALLVFVFPQQGVATGLVLGFLALSLLGSALVAVRRILDDITLTYDAFDDHISIHGGYFNIRREYLRSEHITDTATSQEVLDRLLDVEAITVSVAGGERAIQLPYLPREAGFDEVIPRRTGRFESVTSDDEGEPEESRVEDDEGMRAGRVETSPHMGRNAVGLFAVVVIASPLRVAFPALSLLVLFYGAQRFFRPLFTTYSVTDTMIQSEFSFLQRAQTRFEKDRVTGVTVKRNPLDWLFGTVTVLVQSVGSSGRLALLHVSEHHPVVDDLQGLKAFDNTDHVVRPTLRPTVFLSRYLPGLLGGLAVMGGLVGRGRAAWAATIAVLLVLIGGYRYWRLRFASLRFGYDHFELDTGWLFERRRRAAYKDVKRVRSCLYPLSDAGSIAVFIPGGRGASAWSLTTGWELPCVVEPWQQHGVVDGCVLEERWSAPLDVDEVLWEDSPDIPALSARNTVAGAVLAGVLFGLVSLDVVSMPVSIVGGAVIVGVLALSLLYHSQSIFSHAANRYIAERGLLYRCATTVLKEKLDYTDQQRSWYDLLFNTGSVSIYTTGSMESDMVFNSIRSSDGVFGE